VGAVDRLWRPGIIPRLSTYCDAGVVVRGLIPQLEEDLDEPFSSRMALRLTFIAKSAVSSVKPFHTAGLVELLLKTFPYAVGLLGHQTSPRAISFSDGHCLLSTPATLSSGIKETDHHSGNSHRGRLEEVWQDDNLQRPVAERPEGWWLRTHRSMKTS
jgi:hypothetical protein